jgi:hypothetical protein
MGQQTLSYPLNQIIIFNFHFNKLETLKVDDTTPLGDILTLFQVIGEEERGYWGSLSLLFMC